MGVTIIGSQAEPFPEPISAPLIRVKQDWSDDWVETPEFKPVACSVAAGGADLSTFQYRRPYGTVKHEWESGFSSRDAIWGGGNWWIQLLFSARGPDGWQEVFVGRISGEDRQVFGGSNGPTGWQTWVAYGPMQILRKIAVSKAYWWVDSEVVETDWVPTVNKTDDQHGLIGNRTELEHDGTYLYAGDQAANGYNWSYREYIEYILARFVDESADGGPAWSLGGQAELLESMTEPVTMDETQTVADILGRLINPRLGLDYYIRSTDDGFEVCVFALSAIDWSFAGETLSKNPDTFRIAVGSDTPDLMSLRIARSVDHSYGRIRVIGRRIVVCSTLYAESSKHPDDATSLEGKWDEDLEDEYADSIPEGWETFDFASPRERDEYRKKEKFRGLWQTFAAPSTWYAEAPPLTDEGEVDVAAYMNAESPDGQKRERKTLDWLPLRVGWDYTVDPPTNSNPDSLPGDFLPPLVLVPRELPPSMGEKPWVRLDTHGIGLSALQTDYGVHLHTEIPHVMLYPGVLNGTIFHRGETEIPPRFNHNYLVATIAAESDQRLELVWQIPEEYGGGTPGAGTKDYYVGDAELWFLASRTVVGVEDNINSALLKSPLNPIVLRNDNDRLARVMAGAIARYFQERARASITVKGLNAWGMLLGTVLTVVEDGGDSEPIQAPVTRVAWAWPSSPNDTPTTTINTGFAE